eukprot:2239314-Rhodomonas_salina.1
MAGRTMDTYLDGVRKADWADEAMISAAARVAGANVTIWRPNGGTYRVYASHGCETDMGEVAWVNSNSNGPLNHFQIVKELE